MKSTVLLLCMLAVGVFSSCSSDDDNTPTGATSEEVVSFIKSKLYDNQGNVAANKLDTYQKGEYNLIADEESEVCYLFTMMTGIEAESGDTYKYVYQSADGKHLITIEGSRTAENAVYATILFSIPECPEIKIIHIGTPAIMEGTNAEDDGYRHRIKGVC
ncbi:hypothetical protein [Bacteroides sp.]